MRLTDRWLSLPCALLFLLNACNNGGSDGEADAASNLDDIDATVHIPTPVSDAAVDGSPGAGDIDAGLLPGEAGVVAPPPGDAEVDQGSDTGGPDATARPQPDASSDSGAAAEDAAADAAPEEDAATTPADAGETDAAVAPVDAGDSVVDGDVPGDDDAGAVACTAPEVGRLGLETVVSSSALSGLTDATQPPGSNDWYLTEQRGRVMVLREGETALTATTFLDLTSEISLRTFGYEDRGLVSIAFAPDYATSGRVYVSVTPNQGAFANVDLLLEYTRSADDPYRVDPSSRRIILELRGQRLNDNFITVNIHNGGRVAFGPDGMLYLAMGDGGGVNCGDVEPGATQEVDSLFGKMLRLDLSRPAPYGAADNPFVADGDPRVWQYGLRNPFRFSFDRANGDLYLGDVGQNSYEEIDYAPSGVAGLNFGWARFEGDTATCPHALRAGSTHTPPIFVAERFRGATGLYADYNAVIGGIVYRGSALPELQGVYVFGDYVGKRMASLRQCGVATSPVTPILKRCDINEPNAACLQSLNGAPAFSELRAVVEDHAGEMYVVANGNSLLKVVPVD